MDHSQYASGLLLTWRIVFLPIRTDLELDSFRVLQRRVLQEWRRALEMMRLMTSKGYFLARRDIVRESSSVCSMLSSAMRKLYLRENKSLRENNAFFVFK